MGEIQAFFAKDETMLAAVNVLGIIAGGWFVISAMGKIWLFALNAWRTSLRKEYRRNIIEYIRWARYFSYDGTLFLFYAVKQFCRTWPSLIIIIYILLVPSMGDMPPALAGARLSDIASPGVAYTIRSFLFSIVVVYATLPMINLYLVAKKAHTIRYKRVRRRWVAADGSFTVRDAFLAEVLAGHRRCEAEVDGARPGT